MEMLRSWGLAERILAGGVDVEMSMLEMPTVARAAEGFRIDIGYPSPAQSAMVSPMSPAAVPQDHLESILLEHLADAADRHPSCAAWRPLTSGRRPSTRS